jgi:tetratricopeptide (TPR) repeat protein
MTLFHSACTVRLRALAASALFLAVASSAQTPVKPQAPNPGPGGLDRSASYYHYGLAHLYENMAVNAGRSDYASQAIDEYKLALAADPTSKTLQDGLADLYFKLGRIREAVTAAQQQVTKNPNDLQAHELLGKVYLRSLGDMQTQQSGEMLQLAIAEYEKLIQLKPADIETHLLLGQLYGLNHDSAKAEAQFKGAQKMDPNSEEVVLNIARLYTEQGDFRRAAEVLAAVPQEDQTARIEFALGASYDQLKRPKEAAAAYRAALDLDPENALDTERGLGNALLLDGQLDEARKVFNQIVASEPQDAQSQIRISEIERRQGHYEQALETLNKAKALVQDSTELSYNEALIYDSLGRYDNALNALKQLLAASNHPDGNYTDPEKSNRFLFLDRLGAIEREQGKTAESIGYYKQMTALGGEFALRGYQSQVDTYREAHQQREATAVAEDAAKVLSKDRGVQLMYAGQLADTGKPEEGFALARTQLKNTSEDREVYLALAQMDVRLKRWADAEAELSKAMTLASKPDEKLNIYFLRGTLYDRQKLYDQAEENFSKALAIDPQNPTILNYVGYMLADRGVRLAEATAMIRKAVDLDPQNYAFLDSLGWVYYKSGQYPQAEQYLRQAIERSSSDPTVHDHLGEVYEKTGRLKLAVEQWERSMTEYAHSLPADADPEDVSKVQHKLQNARVKLARLGPVPATAKTAKP